jgi:HSP20 family protein
MARLFVERTELPADLQHLFNQLWEDSAPPAAAGDCTPPVDVLETDRAVEVVVDLPGVPATAIKIVFARNVLVIAGEKLPPPCSQGEAGFHLAERGFGRFARAVRLDGAVDAGRASATLASGELRVLLPRLAERRGAGIRIPIRP